MIAHALREEWGGTVVIIASERILTARSALLPVSWANDLTTGPAGCLNSCHNLRACLLPAHLEPLPAIALLMISCWGDNVIDEENHSMRERTRRAALLQRNAAAIPIARTLARA